MALMVALPSASRTTPRKQTTAPTPRERSRPRVSDCSSMESVWMRSQRFRSSSLHRREKGNLIALRQDVITPSIFYPDRDEGGALHRFQPGKAIMQPNE